ncbi:hypothetical protein [Amycolatopsis sp. RTGN1]|uniref:hypothetical protein n=1 Tax=Amycolatopsis ponsaeliensis TaxID=2992142 RepID=UPI00254B62B2|nr:hypothetical protein [Amycolatopsis sp. RTGN1]
MAEAEVDVADAAGLDRQVRGIVAAVVVLSRLATLAMVALSIVGGTQSHAYTRVPLATIVYVVLAGWSAVLITLVLRRPVRCWSRTSRSPSPP